MSKTRKFNMDLEEFDLEKDREEIAAASDTGETAQEQAVLPEPETDIPSADTIAEVPEEKTKEKRTYTKREKKEPKAQPEAGLPEYLLAKKKTAGVQKSVYFEREVYDALNETSKKYGVSFSQLMNIYIRKGLEITD